jgi:hypothetical protein
MSHFKTSHITEIPFGKAIHVTSDDSKSNHGEIHLRGGNGGGSNLNVSNAGLLEEAEQWCCVKDPYVYAALIGQS